MGASAEDELGQQEHYRRSMAVDRDNARLEGLYLVALASCHLLARSFTNIFAGWTRRDVPFVLWCPN